MTGKRKKQQRRALAKQGEEVPAKDIDALELEKRVEKHVEKHFEERILTVFKSWSGPLPQPSDLKAFKDIQEDFPERIVAMTEASLAHNRALEARVADAEICGLSTGRWMAFLLGMGVLGLTAYGMYLGHTAISMAVVTVGIALLTLVFLVGVAKKRKP